MQDGFVIPGRTGTRQCADNEWAGQMKQRNRHKSPVTSKNVALGSGLWCLSWEESVLAWRLLEETRIGKNCLGLCGGGRKQAGFDIKQIIKYWQEKTNLRLSQRWMFLNFSYLYWSRSEQLHNLKADILRLMPENSLSSWMCRWVSENCWVFIHVMLITL